jgi:hypothetical protein
MWWSEAVGKPRRKESMRSSASASPKVGRRLWKKGQGLKPDLGNPATEEAWEREAGRE